MCYKIKMPISLKFIHRSPKNPSKVLKLEQLVQKCKLYDNIQDQDEATKPTEWIALAVIKATPGSKRMAGEEEPCWTQLGARQSHWRGGQHGQYIVLENLVIHFKMYQAKHQYHTRINFACSDVLYVRAGKQSCDTNVRKQQEVFSGKIFVRLVKGRPSEGKVRV